nr:EOG090X0438 [Eulimnadia texana]
MKFTVFLLAALLSLAYADSVVDLTDDNFDAKINSYDTALVMFYAPWCGHCKRLKPEFEKASELVKNDEPPITLAKVDCTEGGKSTCNRFSVQGYPTMKIFRGGEVSSEYNGPREANGIVKYMRAQDSTLKAAFLKLADKLRESVRFGVSSDSDSVAKYGEDKIVLFRPKHLQNKFEDSTVTFDGEATTDSLNKWIEKNYHGLVGHRTVDNSAQFRQPLVIAYYGVDYVKNPKGTNYWRNRILKVAKSFKGEFNFAVSNKDDFQQELNEFGFEYVTDDKPRVAVRDASGKKFVLKETFSPETLESFLKDVQAGKVEPYLKSEPIPDNSAPLKVAVGKNFDEVVTNNGKDTLIEFYAPWCGHCKKLAPAYEELANTLKDEDVAIVKMDATANDVPSNYEVRGFPTLFWLPKDNKSAPRRYDGGREVDDFIKYIAKHATNELKGFDRAGNPKSKEEL